MPSLPQTEDQLRAKKAWEQVKAIKSDHPVVAKGYRAIVRSAGSDILKNGLGQTLAFYQAKAKGKADTEHALLYSHLAAWLAKPIPSAEDTRYANNHLLEWLIKDADSDTYRQVTVEAIAYINTKPRPLALYLFSSRKKKA